MRYLLSTALLCAMAPAQITYLSAALDGAQENPPVATPGRGWSVVRLEEPANTVRAFIFTEGLTGPITVSHIHLAPTGVNGAVIVPLTVAGNLVTGTGPLTPAQVTAMKTDGTYVNVHTALNPGGEIRGQLVTSVSTRFAGVLSGSQEVPPTGSAATGTFVAFLHEPDNRLVYEVNTSGLVNVTAAHVHPAPAGVNGPVLFPLNGGAGNYCGVSDRLTAAQVATLKANGMYFNVHTAAFPGGEIRGQMILLRDDFIGRFSGLTEVPPTPSLGDGTACVRVAPNGSVTVTANFAGLGGAVLLAHIHTGPPGIAGPILFTLTITGPNTVSGTFTPSTADLGLLRSGNWYANLHTAAFPNGEVRAQLGPATLPATFGGGCPGSNGIRPEIGADGFPCLGTSFAFKLYGTNPGALTVLAIGFNRDQSGPLPLPQQFTTLGFPAPGCFFLLDPAATNVVFANAMGCASFSMSIPFIMALRGVPLYGQDFVFDLPANPFGLVGSNGLSLVVQ
jgi:hypothetical protein